MRSPIYSHFGETLSGVSTIRAFGATRCFIGESNYRMDTNQQCYYPSFIDNRWLAVRLEFCGNLVVLFTAVFSVLSRESFEQYPGYVGLMITYALTITQTLNWLVRMTSELETSVVSVERIGKLYLLTMCVILQIVQRFFAESIVPVRCCEVQFVKFAFCSLSLIVQLCCRKVFMHNT